MSDFESDLWDLLDRYCDEDLEVIQGTLAAALVHVHASTPRGQALLGNPTGDPNA
jgi:hypothetical protein